MSTGQQAGGEPPPLIDQYTADFNAAQAVGAASHQIYLAWHDLHYTILRRNQRQVNRIRVYGSQLAGAVR